MRRQAVLLPTLFLAANASWSQTPAPAQQDQTAALKADLARERATLAEERKALDEQEARLTKLEDALAGVAPATSSSATPVAAQVAPTVPAPGGVAVEPVGEAPVEPERPPPVAALGDQGGIITRRRLLTVEGDFEYAHADNNEVIFRGIEVPQSVLVGVFDINESRQDIVTAALVARYGITNRLEGNIRVPFIYRDDSSELPPAESATDMSVGSQATSAHALHVGDTEFGLRYQFTDGHDGRPYLIGGVQVLTPTGTSPYFVPRDTLGNPLRSATGAGFWAVEPTLTALLPSDPAVLFASLGYTQNFGRNIDQLIGGSFIDRVRPGGEPALNVGIGLSVNPRTAISFAYAHTLSFGTKTTASVLTTGTATPTLGPEMENTTRDLQIGQFVFGVSYRLANQRTLNWNVEIGATNDAPAVVTTFRIPMGFDL